MDPLLTKAQVDVQERIQILPQELIDLITDGTIDAVTFTVEEKYGINTEQKTLLENEIILVLTLFLPKSTFTDNVRDSLNVSDEVAYGISEIVNQEIFVLVDDILELVESGRKELNAALGKVDLAKKIERKEDLTKLAQTFTQPTTDRPAVASVEEVEPIRTMAQDMNRVHGYGAYRAEEAEQKGTQETPDASEVNLNSIIPKKEG